MPREIKVGLVLEADGKGFRGEVRVSEKALRLNPCPDGEGIKTAALDRRRRGILVYSGMNK